MTYKITHRTTYEYKHPVSLGNHIAYLTPRSLPHQRRLWNEIQIQPFPSSRHERADFFGNQESLFTVQEPHKELVVEARSEVTIDEEHQPWVPPDISWEQAIQQAGREGTAESVSAVQFLFESPRIRVLPEFAAYARQAFTPGRPFGPALLDLAARIHTDFRFDSKATNVRTGVEEVFRKRRGVCQDFAHLQIACLRSLKIPARYVSGYLRTYPPPGRPRLVGADASHAWVSAYCPGFGWLDVDPTNNLIPSRSHVTLAWGRDYGDISPLRGLILGGREHTLTVAVDMLPIE